MGRFGVGQAVRRSEDPRLLTGRGRYADDIDLPRQAHAVFLRSPHAHALIEAIDTARAAAAPGVLGVYTAADVAAAGLGALPCLSPVVSHDGSPMVDAPRPLLAAERVRHVGDTVAMVVAEDVARGKDAAELIAVDYEPLPAVADTAAAVQPGAPLVWDEAASNTCFDWRIGDAAATERAFAAAAHVTAVDLVNNRIVANPLEPRAALGDYDRAEDRYTLHTSTQGSHKLRNVLSESVLKVPAANVRVVTRDVGGSFGIKIFVYAEQALVLWAARKLGRPVKWTSERGEGFITDTHGRDHATRAELALDADGRFLGLRVSIIANLGAYVSAFGPFIPTDCCCPMLTGVYTLPAAHAKVRGVFTHTVPVDAYRGAGRPEAAYLIERLVDVAALELGLAPAELRRRNYVSPSAMPYRTALGMTFDHGDFARNMDDAMARAGWADFPARRAEARARGKLRGIGLANYIERCGGPGNEEAEIRFEPDGAVIVSVGTQSNGQGHETAYAQVVAERLGVPFESIRVAQGDTASIRRGEGTGGSRSLAIGGTAIGAAAARIIEQGKHIAAHLLETAAVDIEFSDGIFSVAGTDRAVPIVELAKASFDPSTAAAAGIKPGLDEFGRAQVKEPTYPNGCHVCEVEIDEETGLVSVVAYTVVDDFGKLVNPLLVEGQVHGGVVQGIGQALLERCAYEAESGQLLSASFMDYCIPRADDVPSIAFATNETPCTSNPLGVKGCGEAGAIGAPPAVVNAVVDALSEFGVRHIDMPATPELIWRAIERAKTASGS
jgi:carbon-monoxide dehydrogenase large subunit